MDEEVAVQAGPQLVVPVLNARFAANAANARWGSLYDALYGTDVLPEDDGQERGVVVQPEARRGRDREGARLPRRALPARRGQPRRRDRLLDRGRRARRSSSATASPGWPTPAQYLGHRGDPADPEGVLLIHHGLHVEIQVDRDDNIGKDDAAGVKDLLMEAAVSTIMDLEDSVAAVDPDDKVAGYRNWLQLNQGTLTADHQV